MFLVAASVVVATCIAQVPKKNWKRSIAKKWISKDAARPKKLEKAERKASKKIEKEPVAESAAGDAQPLPTKEAWAADSAAPADDVHN